MKNLFPPSSRIATELSSFGGLEFNPVDEELKSFLDGRQINCEGTLEIYVGGYMNFNLLYLEFTSDTDQSKHYLSAPDWADKEEDTMVICIKYGPNKTVTVWDESKNPLFGKVKLRLAK